MTNTTALRPVHHATVKSAASLGFIVGIDEARGSYFGQWPEGNKTIHSDVATSLIADLKTLKMLAVEYPTVRAVQDADHSWSIVAKSGAQLSEQHETLDEAWEEAAENMTDDADASEGDEADGEVETGDGSVESDEAGDDEPKGEGKSIVKRKYKKAYRPFHNTCGDELTHLIRQHVCHTDDDGEERIDPAKLRAFAIANGCWVDSYSGLNIGQQRMNVGNRLRHKVKNGHEIVWA
jgi:hypothetical protein